MNVALPPWRFRNCSPRRSAPGLCRHAPVRRPGRPRPHRRAVDAQASRRRRASIGVFFPRPEPVLFRTIWSARTQTRSAWLRFLRGQQHMLGVHPARSHRGRAGASALTASSTKNVQRRPGPPGRRDLWSRHGVEAPAGAGLALHQPCRIRRIRSPRTAGAARTHCSSSNTSSSAPPRVRRRCRSHRNLLTTRGSAARELESMRWRSGCGLACRGSRRRGDLGRG